MKKKDLYHIAKLAQDTRLVADSALLEMVQRTLRQWRNLVHPDVAQRTGISLDEDRAAIAVRTVRALSRSLGISPPTR